MILDLFLVIFGVILAISGTYDAVIKYYHVETHIGGTRSS